MDSFKATVILGLIYIAGMLPSMNLMAEKSFIQTLGFVVSILALSFIGMIFGYVIGKREVVE